jgi:hypothetical protein
VTKQSSNPVILFWVASARSKPRIWTRLRRWTFPSAR